MHETKASTAFHQVEARIVVLAVLRMIKENYALGIDIFLRKCIYY